MGHGKTLSEAEKAKNSTLKDYLKLSNHQIAKEINQSEIFSKIAEIMEEIIKPADHQRFQRRINDD